MTHRVLDVVDHYMLLPSPEKRITMGMLCDRLDEIIVLSTQEYQQKLDNNVLRPVGPETLRALLEIDNRAPLKAAIATAMVEVGLRSRSETGRFSQVGAVDDRLECPNGSRKSERFDKIVFAKTANRVRNSQLLPETSKNPSQLPEETRVGSEFSISGDEKQQDEHPDIRLDGRDSSSVEEPSSMWPPQEKPLNVLPYNMTIPESLSPGLPDTRSSSQPHRSIRDLVVLENRQTDVQNSSAASDESFKVIPSGTFELPGSGVVAESSTAVKSSHLPSLFHDIPSEGSSSTNQLPGHEIFGPGPLLTLGGNEPELSKTAIFQEYTVLQKNWGDKKKSLLKRIQGVPLDLRLQRFISERDIVRLAFVPQ